MKAMIESFVAGCVVSYSVTAPTPVISPTAGEVSSDGKTVNHTISLSDYLELEQPVMLEVKW